MERIRKTLGFPLDVPANIVDNENTVPTIDLTKIANCGAENLTESSISEMAHHTTHTNKRKKVEANINAKRRKLIDFQDLSIGSVVWVKSKKRSWWPARHCAHITQQLSTFLILGQTNVRFSNVNCHLLIPIVYILFTILC